MDMSNLLLVTEAPYLLAACNCNNGDSNRFMLSNVSNRLQFEFDVSFLHEKLFIGSQFGFVAVLDQYSEPSLFNLRTGESISLPSITTLPTVHPCCSANDSLLSYFHRGCYKPDSPFEKYTFEYFSDAIMLHKVIFSSNPSTSSGDFTVAALVGVYLAIVAPGKSRWNLLESQHYRDIIFNQNGILIGTTYYGAIHEIKLKDDDFLISEISEPFITYHPQKIYIAEDCYGRIYLITRGLDISDTTYTTGVKVYRRNEEGDAWEQIKCLDGQAFFIGTNAAFSIKKEDIRGEIKPDTVYFTDDWWEVASENIKQSPRDICAYNLIDNSIELCYPSERRQCTWPLPIWIDFRNLN